MTSTHDYTLVLQCLEEILQKELSRLSDKDAEEAKSFIQNNSVVRNRFSLLQPTIAKEIAEEIFGNRSITQFVLNICTGFGMLLQLREVNYEAIIKSVVNGFYSLIPEETSSRELEIIPITVRNSCISNKIVAEQLLKENGWLFILMLLSISLEHITRK